MSPLRHDPLQDLATLEPIRITDLAIAFTRYRALPDQSHQRLGSQSAHSLTITPSGGSMQFSTFATKWLNALPLSPGSQRSYRSHLKCHMLPTFGSLKVESLTDDLIELWLKTQVSQLDQSQLKSVTTRMRSLLEEAVPKQYLTKHLFQKKH